LRRGDADATALTVIAFVDTFRDSTKFDIVSAGGVFTPSRIHSASLNTTV
jgi:hypothetical protein